MLHSCSLQRSFARIQVNTIIPQAVTRMTNDLNDAFDERRVQRGKKPGRPAPAEVMARMSPAKVAAMVAYLAHETCPLEATIHEAGAGYFAQLRWARSAPLFVTEAEGVSMEEEPTPEHIRDGQAVLADFANGDMPESGDGRMGSPSALEAVFAHLQRQSSSKARL